MNEVVVELAIAAVPAWMWIALTAYGPGRRVPPPRRGLVRASLAAAVVGSALLPLLLVAVVVVDPTDAADEVLAATLLAAALLSPAGSAVAWALLFVAAFRGRWRLPAEPGDGDAPG